ncbi:MAG: DUF2924 domain-containing protein [Hyphomicrobiales bacterium]|nr:DUF2924 domain-containing protein [Hyphomicrobiales bacterium]
MITKLDRELEQLEAMSRAELVERWRAIYGCPPPAGVRRGLLIYAAGWDIQVKRLGNFSGEARRMLRREIDRIRPERRVGPGEAAGDRPDGTPSPNIRANGEVDAAADNHNSLSMVSPSVERRKPVAGARLLRDWNGRTHVIDVIENGYLYDGSVYRSLSAIARRITGVHWSGPRFFGL